MISNPQPSIDPLLLVLGLTQTCFEGSMYIFVFSWVPTLQEATRTATLPLGIIFSAFMLSMMIGSLLYTAIISNPPTTRPGQQGDSPLTVHAKLSSLVCATSALALAASVSSPSEYIRFGAFCVFEACVGMYYPVQGMLRGTLISDGHRATVKSFFLESVSAADRYQSSVIRTFPCAAQRLRSRLVAHRCRQREESRAICLLWCSRFLRYHDRTCYRSQGS